MNIKLNRALKLNRVVPINCSSPKMSLALQEWKKAWVAILISHSCPLRLFKSVVDPDGRYIILRAVYQGTPILCKVYVPNVAQINFLCTFLLKLSQMPSSPLIIGGDLNIAFSDVANKLLLPGKQLSPTLKNLSRAFC